MENEVLDITDINQEQYVNCFKSELMARERSAEAPSQHRQVTHATGQTGYLLQQTWSSPLYLLDMVTSSQALGITGLFFASSWAAFSSLLHTELATHQQLPL